MRRFLIIIVLGMLLFAGVDYLYFYNGALYLPKHEEPISISSVDSEKLCLDRGGGPEIFEIRGVNLGLGKPGHYATEHSITKEEYMRWFQQIKDMGANVIRTYTVASPDFYEAFYLFNHDNPDPLYLIHGVWVDDYLINSSHSAFDQEFYDPFLRSCRKTVDIIHGRHKDSVKGEIRIQNYKWDISPWVYGYILGVEWESDLVVFTDFCVPKEEQYQGKYLYTEDASNFEIFLAAVGDLTIRYETEKYGMQHAVAFSNWPTTSPLDFDDRVRMVHMNYGQVDMEKIHETDKFKGGLFASYHIYPYYPEYSLFEAGGENCKNTYLDYLTKLNEHHAIPVVISEFGVPSSRGMASYEENRELHRDQGRLNEKEQGEAFVSMYEDIMKAGSAGGIVFTWQDEWFKRTWNTMAGIDLDSTSYWSDIQTNEQHFGILSFDPGEKTRVCYVDGDDAEWSRRDISADFGEYTLSMKTDQEGLYFLLRKPGLDLEQDTIYIPIDTTPVSGSRRAANLRITMDEPADFIVRFKGKERSRVWVHKRYNFCDAMNGEKLYYGVSPFLDPPAKNIDVFERIHLPLHEVTFYRWYKPVPFKDYSFERNVGTYMLEQKYETGKLRYGNANPKSPDFDSIADFCAGDDFIEFRLPWQMLNFADPTSMMIHDDYYEHYGVEYRKIDHMNIGVGDTSETIHMVPYPLKPLGRKPKYHERLKQSYYILQDYWAEH